jgi:hypothetical protein
MPLINPIDIAVLSSPLPLPGESGTVSPGSFGVDTQENFSALTRGSGVSSPIGTGNQMMPVSFAGIEGEAAESGGANVGGLVKTEQDVIPTDIEFTTAQEEEDAAYAVEYEGLVDDYEDAYDDTGMRGARDVKAEDRQGDKTERQAAFDADMEAAKELKGSEKRKAKKGARSKKRATRKDTRKQRRSAFKDFKANR